MGIEGQFNGNWDGKVLKWLRTCWVKNLKVKQNNNAIV